MTKRDDGLTFIEISTLLSARTEEGMVEFQLNDERTQWDLPKAREIHRMLGEAIEAAVSDGLIYRFLVQTIGLSKEAAAGMLVEFRKLRQGSYETVYPS